MFKDSKLILLNVILLSFLFTTACNNKKPEDSKEIAEEHNEAKFDNSKNEKDAQFLVNVAEMNMEEIILGQLAQQRGIMSEVKELGKMMETDHNKTLGELTILAQKKAITLPAAPTNESNDTYKNLSEKSAKDFDKDYCNLMVDKHKDAIEKFEKMSTDAGDPEIRNWASQSLIRLRQHLDHAMLCHEKSKKL